MEIIIDNFILFFHVLFLIVALVVPFTNSNYFLMMYIITIPFIMIHWICQDNTCMITLVEKQIRGSQNECITCKLIEPIYDFPKNYKKYGLVIYGVTIVLLLVAISKLSYKWYNGNIKSLGDLFKI